MIRSDRPSRPSKSFRVDLLANYVAVLISGGIGLLVMPLYARHLGDFAWGEVSLCLLIQSVTLVFDMGLSQMLPRDVAQALHAKRDRLTVLGCYFRLYFLLAAALSSMGALCVPLVVSRWFNDSNQGADLILTGQVAVIWGALQLLNGAVTGFWSGSQMQAKAIRRATFFVVLRHSLTFVMLWQWGGGALAFFLVAASVAALELIANIVRIRREEGGLGWGRTTFSDCARVVRVNRSIALGVLLGALVSQADRIILSRAMPPEAFGVYAMVLLLGLAFFQIQYPFMTAVYPRVAVDRDMVLMRANLLRMFLCGVLPCLIAGWGANEILGLYLHRSDENAVVTFRLVLLAVGVNAIYQVFHQYMVAGGAGRWLTASNLAMLVWVIFATHFRFDAWGMMSGGVAWAGAACLQLAFGLMWWKGAARGK